MKALAARLAAIALAWIALASTADAQEPPAGEPPVDELGVEAEVERPIAATGGEDPTASATEIDAQDRPSALDTLEDGIRDAPGARPLRSGAYGSPTTLSLRGSDADQVEVMFGDVPITTADGGAFDLSTVPLWALDRVEVYRGGAPTWLGVGGIGGVVRLVPRDPRRSAFAEGTAGVGSFGLVHGRVGAGASNEDVQWIGAVGATSSEGDFPYSRDLTLLDSSDAREVRRSNGWLREGSGLGNLRLRIGDGILTAFAFGLGRFGGVPGPASQPTMRTHRNETHLLGAIGYEVTDRGRDPRDADWRFAVSASSGYRRRRFSDPLGEIGLLPRETDDEALRTVVRVASSGRALPWLELTGVALYTREDLSPHDARARMPNAASARDAGTFALEGRFFGRVEGVRMELRPSARLNVVSARLSEIRPERVGESSQSLTVAPTLRLGGVLEPVRGVAISASAASATRVPSAIELFGDRGFLLGDTSLRPETAQTFDLGVALRGREGELRGRAELRGFVTLASDLIRYRRNNQFQAVPENVASATLAGGELGVRANLTRHFVLTGALTMLGTWTDHLGQERRLPLRPWLTANVRPELRAFDVGPLDILSVWVELLHVSESFWDPANTSALAERTRIGLGASIHLWGGRLRVDASVRDVFDQRGTDLLGFPLPGRSLAVALTVRSD